MSPLYLYNGKLLVDNGALANDVNCCCTTGCPTPTCTGIECYAFDIFNTVDCNRNGIHIHTITIPEEYTLPVPINITGNVDDDLLIDGQSITIDLGLDPGPYPSVDPNCVGSHTIGDQPGPFKDLVHGGITFPMNNRSFEVSLRDTIGANASISITICLDPNNTQGVCLPPTVSGCCYSGVELYCFEKTTNVPAGPYGEPAYDCVTKICATGIPEGETGWSQIGGPYDCGCDESCSNSGNCLGYTDWKIIDQNNYVYASGDIRYEGNALLDDLPNPFTPLFYNSTGEKNFKLQALCSSGDWHNIQTWNGTITLCNSLADRYPSEPFSGPWATQGDCSKRINEDGDFICDINGQSTSCPFLSPGTLGDGQAWRDPDHTVGVTFTGAVDGEWTNLANWKDANNNSPARYLPDGTTNVTIDGDVTSAPNNYNATVNILTININKKFAIAAQCVDLVCAGTIDRPSPVCPEQFGKITCTGSAVLNGGTLDGELINGEAQFNNNSTITADGVMTGSAVLDDSDNFGTITGNAEFKNNSRNIQGGVVQGDAIFRTGSLNTQATVEGNATFYDDSSNSSTVEGNAEFWDTSTNVGIDWPLRNAVVQGNATFNNASANMNAATVNGESTFNDTSYNIGLCVDIAIFNGNSSNNLGGVCQSDTTFNNSATNSGVCGTTATFNNSSRNTSTGVINNAAIFNDTSENEGDADGGATFNNSSINDSTGSVLNGAVFNTSSKNKGEVTGDGIFNNSSVNDTTGVVALNATFNNDSINKGTVISTATFNNDACNDSGTAGTFIPDPPPAC